MKKYIVTVNGVKYEVELEVADAASVSSAPAAPAAAPARTAAPAGGTAVNSPLPGTVLSVNVANGSSVKKGQLLFVVEAMKMENEILAPCDGTVNNVSVTKGATVDSGSALCVIA